MILLRSDSSRENHNVATVLAPAKLNLSLDVLAVRDDGYHELETLMSPLELHDTLTVTSRSRGDGVTVEVHQYAETARTRTPSGGFDARDSVPNDATNLAVRAVERLRQRAGEERGADIQLAKRIPSMAGLGGGSSDAAAALVAANAVWNLGWSRERLADVAMEVGSDVPFFLARSTAVCRGRGERVTPVRHATRTPVIVVQPEGRLATPDVFRAYDQGPGEERALNNPSRRAARLEALIAALRLGHIAKLGALVANDLQAPARRIARSVDQLLKKMARLDVAGCAMTGSGSACYAICHNTKHARRAAAVLRGGLQRLQLCRIIVTHIRP